MRDGSENNIIKAEDSLKKVATIILAGGQGTRLFPLTATRCKPAVPFGGKYRLIDIPLSNSLNAGINQIYVISQYFAAELHQHILSSYQMDHFRTGELELLTPQETSQGKAWFKGTADAVRQNLPYILRSNAQWFLILSGDQLYNMNLLEMLSFAQKNDADLTIASLPVLEKEAKRMGLLKLGANHQIADFFEKPQTQELLKPFELPSSFLERRSPLRMKPHYLASMGIYVFKREALLALLEKKGDDFGRDLIPTFIKTAHCKAYLYEGYWEDIGTISSYYTANLLLTEGKGLNTYQETNRIYTSKEHIPNSIVNGTRIYNSIIGPGGVIEADEIKRSVIGVRTLIKQGTSISDSIILGNRSYHPIFDQVMPRDQYYSIGKNCLIQRAIIDEETRIGDNVKLINEQNLQTYDGDGMYVRDGIIIITSGTEIPDNFVF